MARATITYTYNPKTGRRDWHVEYQSAGDTMLDEHEQAHRDFLRKLLGDALSRGDEVEVSRGETATADTEKTSDVEAPLREGRRETQ
jgi:hypothetical protein